MLLQYIRNRKNEKVGVVVGLKDGSIGWSLCKTKTTKKDDEEQGVDKFSRKRGIEIAIGRAKRYGQTINDEHLNYSNNETVKKVLDVLVPHSCIPTVKRMAHRLEKYKVD